MDPKFHHELIFIGEGKLINELFAIFNVGLIFIILIKLDFFISNFP